MGRSCCARSLSGRRKSGGGFSSGNPATSQRGGMPDVLLKRHCVPRNAAGICRSGSAWHGTCLYLVLLAVLVILPPETAKNAMTPACMLRKVSLFSSVDLAGWSLLAKRWSELTRPVW